MPTKQQEPCAYRRTSPRVIVQACALAGGLALVLVIEIGSGNRVTDVQLAIGIVACAAYFIAYRGFFRLLFWLVPEMRQYLDQQESTDIVESVLRRGAIAAIMSGIVLTLAALLLSQLVIRLIGGVAAEVLQHTWIIVPLAGWPLLTVGLLRKRLRRETRAYVNRTKRGALCESCGHDLRGQTEPRCPECGDAFDPSLLKAQPNAPGEQEKPV